MDLAFYHNGQRRIPKLLPLPLHWAWEGKVPLKDALVIQHADGLWAKGEKCPLPPYRGDIFISSRLNRELTFR